MKYILKHPSYRKRVFKSREQLENHLYLWASGDIDSLIDHGVLFGWTLEIIPTNNKDTFNLYWSEVKRLHENSGYVGELEYLVENNFKLLAVDRWLSTGSSVYRFPVKIPKKKLDVEFKEYLKAVDFFICPDCNHHAVYDYDENKLQIEWCDNCGQEKILMSSRNYLSKIKLMQDLAS